MTDLNSLSKEELIKLVTQKEEQLRAAEDLAEKRERSNIKFARGVTSLALLLKDVNGSYLAQVEEYLSYADDEEAKKGKKSEKSEAYDINNLKNTLENRLIKIRPLICK